MNDTLTDEMWEKMLEAIGDAEHEIQTIPKTKKIGVWFVAKVINGKICVSVGKTREPKSRKKTTLIPKDEFKRLYPLYIRREKTRRSQRKRSSPRETYLTLTPFSLISASKRTLQEISTSWFNF